MKKKGWKERLRNLHKEINGDELFGSCASHNEGLDCCTEKKWLLDFIEQELDRAREEWIKDGMRGIIDILCEKGCGSMFAVIEEKDVNKKIEELLSKLTTK